MQSEFKDNTTLIEEVRQRPYIWDFQRSDYKNATKNKSGWAEIALQLSSTVEEVKHRWKKLRDSYFRARKQSLEKGVNDGYISKPKWKYFDAMSFLSVPNYPEGSLLHNQTYSLEAAGITYSDFKTENDTGTDEQSIDLLSGSQSIATPVTSTSIETMFESPATLVQTPYSDSLPSRSKRRKMVYSTASKSSKGDVGASAEHSSTIEELFSEEEDTFGRMIAAALKKMSRRNKSTTKFKICQVLYEQELTELGDNDAGCWNSINEMNSFPH